MQLLHLLGVLLSELEFLLKDLHHVVALGFLVDELFVENLVHISDRFFHLRKHRLQLALKFRHDLTAHCLLKLVLDDLPNGGVRQRGC